ncbi:MAG: hypothetical protein KME64_35245 [Scytonematopsis contorta HA4267-MV1]|jgi:hypothetical protein|nr:hypothetical protein [Scytonematopsis contorta HA4267-MV1]
MAQVSHPRRTRILPPSDIVPEENSQAQEKQSVLAMRCRVIFERLRPELIESYYNWHIAIDPETEQYLIDPTLKGITEKIRDAYGYSDEVKLTIFCLNDTGACGRLWL